MEIATSGLAILVWSCDRQNPERAATPFVIAQAAAALDKEVEMLFAAQAVQWLLAEHGSEVVGFGPQCLAVRDYLQATSAMGVRIWACSQSLQALECTSDILASQCSGVSGTVAFLERGTQQGWQTLVF